MTRDVVVATGAGNDSITMTTDTINGALVISTGTSTGAAATNDAITLIGVQVARDATLVGAGVTGALPPAATVSELFLVSDCTFNSNLVVSMGRGNDQLLISTSTVRLSAILTTQAGSDVVAVDNLTVGSSFVLSTGDGELDTVAISAGITVGGFGVRAQNMVINTGSGRDIVSLQASTIARDLVLDLGSGDDFLDLTGNTVNNNALIFGGSGRDTINSNARTVNTFRRAFFFNFEPNPV